MAKRGMEAGHQKVEFPRGGLCLLCQRLGRTRFGAGFVLRKSHIDVLTVKRATAPLLATALWVANRSFSSALPNSYWETSGSFLRGWMIL